METISAPHWRTRVVATDSIARLALQYAGGHVAATRVLHDGLFESGTDATGVVHRAPDRAVLVVTVQLDGRLVGIAALVDRSGRVFSDKEVAVAERVTRPAARVLEQPGPGDGAHPVIERLLQLLGGETAALYRIEDDGSKLALVAMR